MIFFLTKTGVSYKSGDAKKTKPQDMIRLYELVIQNLIEMQQLSGTESNSKYQASIEATISAYKAFRLNCISHFYYINILTMTGDAWIFLLYPWSGISPRTWLAEWYANNYWPFQII